MRLTDCFIDLIAHVAGFLKTVKMRQPAFEKVKADINRLIAKSRELSEGGSFSHGDYDMARFAVLAWIDEVILRSPWNKRPRWQGETLQGEYYRTTDAGEQFFERLNLVGADRGDVREVYYLCLAMGFKGRYCHEGDNSFLEEVKASNLKALTNGSAGISTIEDSGLFPDAYPKSDVAGTPPYSRRFSGHSLICIGFPILVLAVLFLLFRFVLDSYGEIMMRLAT